MATEQHPLEETPVFTGVPTNATWRALILAVIFTVIASFWIDMAEVVTFFCQITESVPAVPAVAFLMALVLLIPPVRRLGERLALSRREVLIIYVFLSVSTSMAGCGIVRYFINTIPVLFYFDNPENDFANYQRHLPSWMAPHDREVIRELYEGSETGKIPWGPWITPIAAWGLFFLAFWVLMMSIMVLFRRQWSEKEKLVYPLLHLPLDITDGLDKERTLVSFFKNRIMWIGFGIAFLYNVSNILNAYNPQIMALGKFYDIGQLFTERPLSALRPIQLHYRPEMLGFGYLVSTEVALSVWVFYLLLKLESLIMAIAGVEISGFPFAQEQSLGAFIALAILLTYVARHHLKDVFRKAFTGDRSIDDSDEPMSYRMAVFGGFGALAVSLGWLIVAGMAPWLAIVYTVLILMGAVVYSRIRAEVGVPLIWMFPFFQHYKAITYFGGARILLHNNSWRSATIFTTMGFMSRGYFPAMMAYQAEGYRLAQDTGIKQKSMSWTLILALVVGFLVAIWLHLRSYYAFGAGGVRALEGWGAGISKTEYQVLTGYAKALSPADTSRMIAIGGGMVMATGLMFLRMSFLRFPLHPLAFAMTTSYGELIWGNFFLVWLIKSIVFKLGGMRAYRQLIPGFIGLALGHFFTAGVLYGLIGTYGGEAFQRYAVWFG
jgi:F0F1-type ATP synthase assembly protein I